MAYRENDLEDPWARTFEWLVPDHTRKSEDGDEEEDQSIKCQKTYLDWLEQSSSQPFWIYGKPGSGKSTLMKRLFHLPRLRQQVKQWAGIRPVAFAAFYFFDRGESALQKTQEGLLRALLYQLISQYRSLAQLLKDILPSDCFPLDKKTLTWNLRQLHLALERVMDQHQLPEKIAFCLFLDGLDEFGTADTLVSTTAMAQMTKFEKNKLHQARKKGYKDILKLVLKLAASSHVKICVSSRDINEFSSVSASYPLLRLEELTRPDIRKYVTENLNKNPGWRQAFYGASDEMSQKIEVILDKARGVFLWVKLVVEQVVDAFDEGAYISEVTSLIDSIPDDLHELYARMLSNIKDELQPQSALLFALVFAGEVRGHISAITLHYAETSTTQQIVSGNACQVLGAEEAQGIVDQMRARLKSRCAGLLEIPHIASTGDSISDNLFHPIDCPVQLMHQTVKDFIDEKGGLSGLFAATNTYSITETALRLLRASILGLRHLSILLDEVQNYDHKPGQFEALIFNWSFIYNSIYYARLLDENHEDAEEVEILLDNLDIIATSVLGTPRVGDMPHHWRDSEPQDSGGYDYNSYGNFLSFVIQANLESYAIRKLRRGLPPKQGKPLLEYALATEIADHPMEMYGMATLMIGFSPSSPRLVRCLLNLGANVNEMWFSGTGYGTTVWESVLAGTLRQMKIFNHDGLLAPRTSRDQRRWLDNMKLLIGAGADVESQFHLWRFGSRWKKPDQKPRSVLDCVRIGLEQWPDERDEIVEMLRQRGAVEYAEEAETREPASRRRSCSS